MRLISALLILGLLGLCACNNTDLYKDSIRIELIPESPSEESSLRWSPKGEKLKLHESVNGLQAKLYLGHQALNPINILLSSSKGDGNLDKLDVDIDRDGVFGGEDDTTIICEPSERRGKIWSSFSGSVYVPFNEGRKKVKVINQYPLSFWYVHDPLEPEEEKVIRYSRRGWMEGKADTGDAEFFVMVTESKMDGVFDRNDSWSLAPDSSKTDLFDIKSARGIDSHNWLGEQAWGIDSLTPSGRKIWLKKVDPQITRAEEERQNDYLAADREAARSGNTVIFMHDYNEAIRIAAKESKNVFIDFETTWCGPCKTMDKWVYTADTVVAVSKNYVCVKIDGDENRNLVKKYEVTGYPTMILINTKGDIIRRVTGYQSVEKLAGFLL